MSQDLQQYADIIEQLKPMINEPEFNQVLAQVAKHVPKEKRFLIKMELKRLARPCMRSLDLRGQVDGECRLYEHGGIKHYLDEIAIEVFEQQLRVFGQYSFGVYEAVKQTENNFRVIREKAQASQDEAERVAEEDRASTTLGKFNVPIVNLLSYAKRQNERMNFAVALEIVNERHDSFRCISVDISTEGIQIKVTKDVLFKPGERLFVHFRGLEDEFAMDKKHGIAYSVLKIVRKRDVQYIALRRAKEVPSPAFDQFLENFIHGNKRRYKVNMSNTIDAIINKSCEQYFSPRCPTLPVYVDEIEGKLFPRYAMTNEVNRDIASYWSDEQDVCRLGYLVSPDRVAALLKKPEDRRETVVYSFTHLQNGKLYFYSASAEELEAKDTLKNLFLGFGARKVSWRVFKLALTGMSPEQAHTPLSIPDSVSSKIKKQNTPPSARLMARLKNLRYLVQVTDITSDAGQRCYAEQKFNRDNLTHLRIFGHARNRVPADIKTYRFKFHEQRLEARYLLRTTCTLTDVLSGEKLSGVSEDISVHGLRIELNGEYGGELDNPVEIALPKLQERTRKYNVMNLQYRVVYHNTERNILHLKAVDGEDGQAARGFFDELIKQNKEALKTYPEEEEIPGIGHALRCINARNVPSLAFVMSKDGVRYVPQASIIGKEDDRITRLAKHFSSNDEINLEFVFRDRKLESPFVQQGVKQVKIENMPVREELYIAFDPTHTEGRMGIIPRYDYRFTSDEMRYNFIKEALTRGQFIALNVMLATTGKPDLEMLQAEMNYVSVYAIHRAKELEDKLWSIAACAHLVDITDEVLLRHNFDRAAILKNREMTAQQKIALSGIKALLEA